MTSYEKVFQETAAVLNQLLTVSKIKPGQVIVGSCSISRVEGKREDTTGDPQLAEAICKALWTCKKEDLYIAVQCCEHINRALIIERKLMEILNLAEVNVLPTPKAGGTFAAVAYKYFTEPVVVEHITADMGIDIGLTMIGMHLKPVVMPLLLEQEYIGKARVVAARTRPKLIGGARAVYME